MRPSKYRLTPRQQLEQDLTDARAIARGWARMDDPLTTKERTEKEAAFERVNSLSRQLGAMPLAHDPGVVGAARIRQRAVTDALIGAGYNVHEREHSMGVRRGLRDVGEVGFTIDGYATWDLTLAPQAADVVARFVYPV